MKVEAAIKEAIKLLRRVAGGAAAEEENLNAAEKSLDEALAALATPPPSEDARERAAAVMALSFKRGVTDDDIITAVAAVITTAEQRGRREGMERAKNIALKQALAWRNMIATKPAVKDVANIPESHRATEAAAIADRIAEESIIWLIRGDDKC